MGTLLRTILKGKVSTVGLMGGSMRGNGKIIKCMALVCSLGLMAVNTLGNTLMIAKRVMVRSSGPMVESTTLVLL